MNCEHAKALFLAYHDEDLCEEEAAALKAHLEECATCAADWEAYRLTLNEVSGMFTLKPPEDFTLRVKQTIVKRSRGKFFAENKTIGLSFAVVSFLLILLFLTAYLYLFSARQITVVPSSSNSSSSENSDKPAPDTEKPSSFKK
jgi:anti-sigma factor RsiW